MGIMRGGRARILGSGAISAAIILTVGASAAPAAGPHVRSGAVTDFKFELNAVSVLSASDAWAVGNSATVLHWNGTSWAPVTIPGLPAAVGLHAVDALSSSDVWAAGGASAGTPSSPGRTLIVHWNGTTWKRVPSPGPSTTKLGPQLSYLSMDSATDGWAVGVVFNRQHGTTANLALHWNGTRWQQVTTSPAFQFSGVASFSPSDATAVGSDQTGSHVFTPAAFHWNGTSWALAATLPGPHGVPASQLGGPDDLSAASGTDLWTVGVHFTSTTSKNLAWHWNGTRWIVMALPSPGVPLIGVSGLTGVAAISPANVWAVGFAATKIAPLTASTRLCRCTGTGPGGPGWPPPTPAAPTRERSCSAWPPPVPATSGRSATTTSAGLRSRTP
jgi:hypothetical protein